MELDRASPTSLEKKHGIANIATAPIREIFLFLLLLTLLYLGHLGHFESRRKYESNGANPGSLGHSYTEKFTDEMVEEPWKRCSS